MTDNLPRVVPHVAIGCNDLDAAQRFYVEGLGASLGRRMDDRITLNFHGTQMVCHHTPDYQSKQSGPYPRHFGLQFRDQEDFDAMMERIAAHGIELEHGPVTRFKGRPDETEGAYLRDPAGNVVEFKWYRNPGTF